MGREREERETDIREGEEIETEIREGEERERGERRVCMCCNLQECDGFLP